MMAFSQSKWSSRVLTLVIWALAAASLVYWALQLLAQPDRTTSTPLVASVLPAPDPVMLGRLLGASPAQIAPQATLASRFELSGVVAGMPGGAAALISVDGKPAAPFRVGAVVEEGLVLQSAVARQAVLGQTSISTALVTLDMPLLPQ